MQAGAIHRGDIVETKAAILLTDMRGFTPLSLTLSPSQLLATLGRYFETVVYAVRAEGGDVLKFLGDGVLSVFQVTGMAARLPVQRLCAPCRGSSRQPGPRICPPSSPPCTLAR